MQKAGILYPPFCMTIIVKYMYKYSTGIVMSDKTKIKYNPPFSYAKHKMSQAFGDLRFRFIPCGYKPIDQDTMVYVKYKPIAKQSFDHSYSIIDTGANFVHFDFPDRELLFTNQSFAIGGDRPFNKPKSGDNWHTGVPLTVASSASDDLPFDRIMINPHAFNSERVEFKLRDNKTVNTTDKIVLSDSGGFQLGHGAIDFIHPGELTGFYMRNADEGVVLDVPARSLGDHDILKHTARVQNLNTKYMKDILPKDFRLATVAHGLALDRMDKFRQDIEEFDSDFSIMCVASTLRFNLLEAIHRIVHIIMTGAEYKQYHILGISNPPLIAVLIKLSYVLKQKGINVLITSDSSSPISFSLKHTYYNQKAFYDGLNPVRVGTKMSSNKDNPIAKYANPHRRFSSTDPLTQIIGGYQDIVSAYPVTVTYEYMIYMNQLELARYCNQMCLTANDTTCEEYKELVNEQYRNSIHRHLLSVTMDYLKTFLEYDIKTAYNKFKYYMPFFSGEHTLSSLPSLIESASEAEKEAEFSVKKKHFVRVLKNYYEFHKSGKVPDKISVNKRMKTGRSLVVKI